MVVRVPAGAPGHARGAGASPRSRRPAHPGPDAHHSERGDQVDPGEEGLGKDVARGEQRHQAEGEHADRVGHGHEQPQQQGVARRAARAHQVGGDHGLAVARRERVERAPAHRQQQREDDDAHREVAGEQSRRGRSATRPRRCSRGRRSAGPRLRPPGPGSRWRRRGHVEGALQAAPRVGRAARPPRPSCPRVESVSRPRSRCAPAARASRCVRRRSPRSRRRGGTSRAPTPTPRGAVPGGVAQHLQAARAGPPAAGLRDRHDRGAAAVDREVDLPDALGGPRARRRARGRRRRPRRSARGRRGSRPCPPPGAGRARRRSPPRAGRC